MPSLPYALYTNIIRLSIIYNAVVNGRLFSPRHLLRNADDVPSCALCKYARIRTLLLPGPIIVYGFGSISIVIKISCSLTRSLLQLIAREMLRRSAWAMAYRGWTVASWLSIEGYCVCTDLYRSRRRLCRSSCHLESAVTVYHWDRW